MGDLEARLLHRGQDRGRRWGGGGHHAQLAGRAVAPGRRRIEDHLHHDGGAAEMGDAMGRDGGPDSRPVDTPQADMGPGRQGHGPGKAPAVAMEHRQRPEIDRMPAEIPDEGIAEGVQIGAAVMIEHALGIARGAGGVVDGDGIPFIAGRLRFEGGIAGGQQGLVLDLAEALAAGPFGILAVDHPERPREQRQRLADHPVIFGIGDQDLRLGMLEDIGDGRGIEAGVDRIQDGPGHGHGEMRLQQQRHIGRHDRDRVARTDAESLQRRCEAPAALMHLRPGEAARPMDHADMLGIDIGRAAEEGDRASARPNWPGWAVGPSSSLIAEAHATGGPLSSTRLPSGSSR